MNDQIIEDAPAPQQPEAPAQAPVEPDRLDRLEATMRELAKVVESAATRVSNIQPAAAPAAPPKPPDEFLNELAADPQGVITRVAQETFKTSADQTLTPAVMQVLDTASKQLIAQQQLKVDSTFGIGTFDAEFRPQLEQDLAELKKSNPHAIAHEPTLEALVNRLYGGANFEKLMDRHKTIQAAAARGHAAHLLPNGGVPRLRPMTADDLPNDAEQFLREVERATGENVDRKRFAKLYYTGVESGPGRHRTSVLDYLKAVGASADTLKTYGG